MADQGNFKVIEGSIDNAGTLFIDGMTGMTISPIVSKLHLHVVVRIEDGKEVRRHETTLVVPTFVLAEICTKALMALKKNEASLANAVLAQSATLVKMLDSIEVALPAANNDVSRKAAPTLKKKLVFSSSKTKKQIVR